MRGLLLFIMMLVVLVGGSTAAAQVTPIQAAVLVQQETPLFRGVMATVIIGDNPDINVRAGPGIDYALLGKLLPGEQAPALGRSKGGDWVQIAFPEAPGGTAWVYSYLVTLSGSVPVVELPATPTPLITPTINPTLAAQFIREISPTRLPTFTPPPPLVIPTYVEAVSAEGSSITFIYIMIGLGLIGVVGFLMSFIKLR
jgi:uncharacterized protein YraI